MRLADVHLHTAFSPDSEASLKDICENALSRNLFALCITDHYDPGHPTCDVPIDYKAYFSAIEDCKAQFPALQISVGLEIGDLASIRPQILAHLDTLPLDFRLLSLHLVDGLDPYDAAFFEGRTQEEAYSRYVDVALESVMHFGDYDAVAHLGYCGKFAPFSPEMRPLRWHHAPDALDVLLRFLAQNGKALEINTSGYKNTPYPIPCPEILRRFAQLGGEFVTFGSDAHTPEFIGYRFDEARALALSCGLRYGAFYKNRTIQPYALEE